MRLLPSFSKEFHKESGKIFHHRSDRKKAERIKKMAGSTFGTLFRVTTWGESHGKGVGAVVDGCPAGLELTEEDIQKYLDRRRPGQNRYTTKRSESDTVRILSGTFEGRTTGTPISLFVPNEDQHSKDYSNLKDVYRPGHADLGFDAKYGLRDYRGGGRSSGRETIGRVAAGAIAAKILAKIGISVKAYTASVGPVSCDLAKFDEKHLLSSRLNMPDKEAERRAEAYLEECMKDGDSTGGTVECIVSGMPAGIGEPVFDKLDALLGQAIFSIGAVKGVEIGDGFAAAEARGSKNNDEYLAAEASISKDNDEFLAAEASIFSNHDEHFSAVKKGVTGVEEPAADPGRKEDPGVRKSTNHAGGILGGMSDGSQIRIRAAFKPTPSISKLQRALGRDGQVHDLEIKGRHDPLIAPRAAVVVECMTAMVLVDLLLRNMGARMETVCRLYGQGPVRE